MELFFVPTLVPEEIARRLDRLLVQVPLGDPRLLWRIERLADDFGSFAASYPLPFWAPGLILSPEMRSLSEAHFPISRVRAVFEAVLRQGCRFQPLFSWTYLHSCPSWLDFLQKLAPLLSAADPAPVLRELAEDPQRRAAFLFALFLPQHYGGGFGRYPAQSQWLLGWLKVNLGRLGGGIRALDSACGSGEGTYELAELIVEAGLDATGSEVHGSTLEPIELFAAAHAFTPHDPARAAGYRARIAPLLAKGPALRFYLDDLGKRAGEGGYDLILCNGLLGGPLLNEPGALRRSIASLAARLNPGGLLLAADRFHAGWKLKVTSENLRALLREQGLVCLEVPEGICGIASSTSLTPTLSRRARESLAGG